MPKKRKFVNKKNSVTFYLGHRSQKDPLIADEEAPRRVLLEVSNKKTKEGRNKQIEEQQKYGIYFDDDYNYLQHLKSCNEKNELFKNITASCSEQKVQLPSSVFGSGLEEDVGLLLKAAPCFGPRPDLDSDIIAALDNDFNFEDPDNILEDNFLELANKDNEYNSSENSDNESENVDKTNYLEDNCFKNKYDDSKSRFTEYSISSSVISRNKQLELLDRKFDQVFVDYEDDNIGPLDCQEIEGFVPDDASLFLQYSDEFQQENDNRMSSQCLKKLPSIAEVSSENSDGEDLISIEVNKDLNWDCESILSANTNIYNRPKIIVEPSKQKIKIDIHTGIPVNVFGENKLTQKNLTQLNKGNVDLGNYSDKHHCFSVSSVTSNLSQLSIRVKGESAEDRNRRKQLLKEYRKERRKEKKTNRLAFKDESNRQSKIAVASVNCLSANKILY